MASLWQRTARFQPVYYSTRLDGLKRIFSVKCQTSSSGAAVVTTSSLPGSYTGGLQRPQGS